MGPSGYLLAPKWEQGDVAASKQSVRETNWAGLKVWGNVVVDGVSGDPSELKPKLELGFSADFSTLLRDQFTWHNSQDSLNLIK